LAPFIIDGGEFSFEGEDGEEWSWEFKDGKKNEDRAEKVWVVGSQDRRL
jgi:hypothetical protein